MVFYFISFSETHDRLYLKIRVRLYRLEDDILLTHSAPAMMRYNPGSSTNKKTYLEPGEFAVWRWLGMNRFFPPLQSPPPFFRGCASVSFLRYRNNFFVHPLTTGATGLSREL